MLRTAAEDTDEVGLGDPPVVVALPEVKLSSFASRASQNSQTV
jgi:hypothetical protein